MSNRMTVKDVWRILLREGVTNASYQSICNWAEELNIDKRFGLTPRDCETLKKYAFIKSQTLPNSRISRDFDKQSLLQSFNAQGETVSGRMAVIISEMAGACDRATFYRRYKKSMGERFHAYESYPTKLMIKIAMGLDWSKLAN